VNAENSPLDEIHGQDNDETETNDANRKYSSV